MLVEWELNTCVAGSHQEHVGLGYVDVGVGSEREDREDGESKLVIPVKPLAKLASCVFGTVNVDRCDWVVGTVEVVVDAVDVAFTVNVGHVLRTCHHVDQLVEGDGDVERVA